MCLGFPAKAREGPREATKGGSGSLHMQGIQDWLDKIQRSCKMLYNIALGCNRLRCICTRKGSNTLCLWTNDYAR